MVFCNSCGKPISEDEYGTEADGSKTWEFCIDCYQNSEFTEPDITCEEMVTRQTLMMMEKNPRLAEQQATGITAFFIPSLSRWRPKEDFENEF
ncbi:MAG: zinc ribbon domain-containing protein [archaeon]|nr:zinc ribbon domain-containing protein [archaeon]